MKAGRRHSLGSDVLLLDDDILKLYPTSTVESIAEKWGVARWIVWRRIEILRARGTLPRKVAHSKYDPPLERTPPTITLPSIPRPRS